MSNVRRLIKGSIAALAVLAGGATAMAVVSNERAPYAPELTNSALQSNADRFRLEFAEWPPRPRLQHGKYHSLIKHRR
jgi:hypothetical protein